MDATIKSISFVFDAEDLLEWVKEQDTLDPYDDDWMDDETILDDTEIRRVQTQTQSASIDLGDAFHQWLMEEIDDDTPTDLSYNLCDANRHLELAPDWVNKPADDATRYLVTYKPEGMWNAENDAKNERISEEYQTGHKDALEIIAAAVEEGGDSGGDQLAAIYDILQADGFEIPDPNVDPREGKMVKAPTGLKSHSFTPICIQYNCEIVEDTS